MSEEQPIVVDLLPTRDRTTTCVLLRSNAPIPVAMLADALASYAEGIKKQLEAQRSKIVQPDKKIIVP